MLQCVHEPLPLSRSDGSIICVVPFGPLCLPTNGPPCLGTTLISTICFVKKWFTNQFEYVADAPALIECFQHPASRELSPNWEEPRAKCWEINTRQDQPPGVQSKYPKPLPPGVG